MNSKGCHKFPMIVGCTSHSAIPEEVHLVEVHQNIINIINKLCTAIWTGKKLTERLLCFLSSLPQSDELGVFIDKQQCVFLLFYFCS